jgi:putative NIF3 family GTP cyclohydrolase 1 type 2
MKAVELLQHFHSVGTWIDPERTVDRIVTGDPETEVGRVLVTWMSTFDAVRAAIDRGCQLLVTHEPTFWIHANEVQTLDGEPDSFRSQLALPKRRFLEESGLVILRCHDVWDFMPEIGIPYAWARFLGLGDTPAAMNHDRGLHRYDIAPTTVEVLATRIAEKTAALGEPAIQVTGDPNQTVSKIGIGTGCYCNPLDFMRLGCDLSIVCDDGSVYWESIQTAADIGHPVLRVNHGTSEEPGMVTLAQYVQRTFPSLTVEHLPHGSCFRLVGRV